MNVIRVPSVTERVLFSWFSNSAVGGALKEKPRNSQHEAFEHFKRRKM